MRIVFLLFSEKKIKCAAPGCMKYVCNIFLKNYKMNRRKLICEGSKSASCTLKYNIMEKKLSSLGRPNPVITVAAKKTARFCVSVRR
jgi:hypothetical protein